MDFYIVAQQLINGLALGSIYGLIAVGYTMVYGIIGMINFAHGDIYMVSAYLTAIAIALLAFLGISILPLVLLLTLLIAVVLTSVYGYVVERLAYRPLRRSTKLSQLISAIGMSSGFAEFCATQSRSQKQRNSSFSARSDSFRRNRKFCTGHLYPISDYYILYRRYDDLELYHQKNQTRKRMPSYPTGCSYS